MKADSDPDRELPELDPAEEERLASALRHAFAPSPIDPERHERLLRIALEDPFAPPSADELVESERLRQAFEGDGEHADLALARALAAAHSPAPATSANLARASELDFSSARRFRSRSSALVTASSTSCSLPTSPSLMKQT